MKVVSLLNCQSSTIALLNFHFPEFIVATYLQFYVICVKDNTGLKIYSTLCVVRQSPWLVQGFGNGTSIKSIAEKLFGRRRVKWWLSVSYLSDARYITAKLRNRMCEKTHRYLRKYDF